MPVPLRERLHIGCARIAAACVSPDRPHERLLRGLRVSRAGRWGPAPFDAHRSKTPKPRPTSPTASESAPATVAALAFFADQRGRLVARPVKVHAFPDRLTAALVIAGTKPSESGLRPAFQPAVFESVSFSGVGAQGEYGVALTHRSFLDASPGMTSRRARTAIRAAVCTVQASGGAAAKVVFYLGGEPASRLFGQALQDGTAGNRTCPHSSNDRADRGGWVRSFPVPARLSPGPCS
jgi:hypothetical protein